VKKGFSLVETLSALVVIGLLVGSFAGPFLRLTQKYRLRSAVQSIHSRMNTARYAAVFKGIKHRVVFDADSITLETYEDESSSWKGVAVHFIEGVVVQANNSPVFLPRGTVTNLATIMVTNAWGGYKITLAISGRIKIAPI